jgi:hypothetical protein
MIYNQASIDYFFNSIIFHIFGMSKYDDFSNKTHC